MKKVLLIISLLLIVLVTAAGFIYSNAVDPLKKAEEKAVKIAKEETKLRTVEEFSIYNGEETYYILQGKNDKGIKIIVWVPEKGGDVTVQRASNGISRQQAINKVAKEIGSDKLISVKLGMENGIPLWEIHSQSQSGLLNYYSLVFQTGDWLKKIENL